MTINKHEPTQTIKVGLKFTRIDPMSIMGWIQKTKMVHNVEEIEGGGKMTS
jgi:hypothetical protein